MKNKKLTLPKSLNLKLSKTVLFCLGGGILLLAIAFLGIVRIQQVSEQQQLTDGLTQVKTRLTGLGITTLETQKEQLQKKVDDANAALQDNTQTLVQYMTSITGDETLFSLAKDCNVVVQDITATETADGTLNNLPCSVFTTEVIVDGTLSDLVDFITRLKTDFGNSIVESVNIAPPSTGSTQGPTTSIPTTTSPAGTETTTTTTATEPPAAFEADVSLSVYIYKGNNDVK
jgi:hypothetical protein